MTIACSYTILSHDDEFHRSTAPWGSTLLDYLS